MILLCAVLLLSIVAYVWSAYKVWQKIHLVTFFNLQVWYYLFFVGAMVWGVFSGWYSDYLIGGDGMIKVAVLGLCYSIAVFGVGFFYNASLLKKKMAVSLSGGGGNMSQSLTVLLFGLICFKVYVYVFDPAPLDVLLRSGFVAAHSAQKEIHQSSGLLVGYIYPLGHTAGALSAIMIAVNSRNALVVTISLLLATWFSGWYFSKYGLIVPFLSYFLAKRMPLKYMVVLVIGLTLFSYGVRVHSADGLVILRSVVDRFFLETGYSFTHFSIIHSKNPPLFFESKYFLGVASLFGVQPSLDYSRDAYEIVTGKYGATSSGFAPVHLYAFWGWFAILVAPVALSFMAYVDAKIFSSVLGQKYYVVYLVLSLYMVNFVTVDLYRFFSPLFVFSLKVYLLFFSAIFIVFILRLRIRFVALRQILRRP